jgi:hypothetical protein|tara:strand:- start:373 stop:525 length:153 start_codon:yes stop_codon:yes gene_type:complete
MKANFKLNKIDNFVPSVDNSDDLQNLVEFDEYLKTLPKGWNLWSTRKSSN